MSEDKNPFFSVVIPTYNHGHLIGRCLDSLLAQTYTNWEAIIVNNFSEDDTIDIVEGYNDSRIHLVNNANHGIIAVSRNKGLELAQGDWICLLDSDDWWTPNKIEECLPYLNDYDFIYTNMLISHGDRVSSKSLRGYQVSSESAYEKMLLQGNPCINSSVVFRKDLIDEVGLISEDRELIAVEDFDYWLRFAQKKKRFKHINKNLGFYWLGGTNISVSKKQIARMEALYAKHLRNILSPGLKQEIVKRLSYREARILQILQEYPEAVKKFKISAYSHNISIVLRSLVFIFILGLRYGNKKRC